MDMEKKKLISKEDTHGDPEIQKMKEILASRTLDSDIDSNGYIILPSGVIRPDDNCLSSNETVKERTNRGVSCWCKEALNEIDEISFLYSGTWEKNINIKMFRKSNGEFSYYIESDDKKGIFDLDKIDLSILVGILFNEFQIDRWDDCYTQKSHLKGVFLEDGHLRRYLPVCDGWCGRLYIKRKDYEKELSFGSAGPESPVEFMEIKKLFTDIFIMDAYNSKKYSVEIL